MGRLGRVQFNKGCLRVNDTVFDVGANIGIYSLWMSKFTPEGNIHSFEPDNDNYNALKKNIELNKLEPSVHINKIGISDSTGFLFLTQGADVKNHLAFEKKDEVQEIPVVTIDDYCR